MLVHLLFQTLLPQLLYKDLHQRIALITSHHKDPRRKNVPSTMSEILMLEYSQLTHGQGFEAVIAGRVHAMYKETPGRTKHMKPLQCTSKSSKSQHTQVMHNTDPGPIIRCKWHCTGCDEDQKGPDEAQNGPDEAQKGPDEA